MPLIAMSLFKATGAARRGISMFDVHCVRPMLADQEVSERNLLGSTAIAPALKEEIGYERAAALVAKSVESGRTLIEIVEAERVMSRERILGLLHHSSKHPDPLPG
jgi:aspartate ammonia-lyase